MLNLLRVLVVSLLAATASWAPAQSNHAAVAVPFYHPADVMAGLHRFWTAPRAAAFAGAADRLVPAVQALCAANPAAAPGQLQAARTGWTDTVQAWERLSAVPVGALLERRSARQIDFTPTRPELIKRAILRAPASAADMERVGTPAKGLPALEWLLWTQPVQPASPACAYAEQVAMDVAREARALSGAFTAAAERSWDEEAGDAAFAEFINQWIGALERLRWAQMERPLREAASRGSKAVPAYPRLASGGSAASWARQWEALRALAVFGGGEAPALGAGVVPLETYLRGRGLNPLADRWVERIARSDAAMRTVQNTARPPLLAASRELSATKRLAEAELAPALEISIGFSDADGD